MAEHFAKAVEVKEGDPLPDSGLRWDHPRLKEYAFNGFAKGWGNEQVCRITGLLPEIVTRYRSEYQKQQLEEKKLKG